MPGPIDRATIARSPDAWSFAGATGGIVNTTTAVTIKAAPADNTQRNYLTDFQIATDALGAATEVAIRDGAGGTVLWRGKLQTTALVLHLDRLLAATNGFPGQPSGDPDPDGGDRWRLRERPRLHRLAMDPALNGIIAPWAQLGIVGSVVLALGVTVYLQWRHIVDLYAAHLADVKACAAVECRSASQEDRSRTTHSPTLWSGSATGSSHEATPLFRDQQDP